MLTPCHWLQNWSAQPDGQPAGLGGGDASAAEQPRPAIQAARALSMIPETRPSRPASPPAEPEQAGPQAGLHSCLQAFFQPEDVTWTCPHESAPVASESEEPMTPGRRLQRRSVSFSGAACCQCVCFSVCSRCATGAPLPACALPALAFSTSSGALWACVV